jgi:hypothetical protein
MTDPRTARIAALAERLTGLQPLEPVTVRLARRALESAQRDLHTQMSRRADARIVDATRYRVQRAHDLLEARWHDAALGSI